MTDLAKLIRENILLLEEGVRLLGSLADTDYTRAEPGVSAVGEHFRHIVNHYDALLSGGSRIDYDTRERANRVASDRQLALAKLRELIGRLAAVDFQPALTVERLLTSANGQLETVSMQTSPGRELDFLISHTTHHYAVIALILRARNFSVGPDFGMSRSTLRHLAGETIPG